MAKGTTPNPDFERRQERERALAEDAIQKLYDDDSWLPLTTPTSSVTLSGVVLNEDAGTGTLVSNLKIAVGTTVRLTLAGMPRTLVVTDVEPPDSDDPLQQWAIGVEEVR